MADGEVSKEIITTKAEPISIEIARGQRGTYGWTIKIYGSDLDTILAQIRESDTKLSAEYGLREPA